MSNINTTLVGSYIIYGATLLSTWEEKCDRDEYTYQHIINGNNKMMI